MKNCPWCGSSDIEFTSYNRKDNGNGYLEAWAICQNCFAFGPRIKLQAVDMAIEKAELAWNTRVKTKEEVTK